MLPAVGTFERPDQIVPGHAAGFLGLITLFSGDIFIKAQHKC